MKILVVDDEAAIRDALAPALRAHGHGVRMAASAGTALEQVRSHETELVLLDLGLPDADGIEIIQRLKALGDVTVIVLSARHLESDKVAALDEGADDYIDKPFGTDELLARIRTVERRLRASSDKALRLFEAKGLRVDFATRMVWVQGEPVRLSPKEFALLAELCRNAGKVVTQRQLLIAGWDDPRAEGQNLRSYVSLLRQKLEADPSEPEIIVTEPGVGYRLTLLPA